MPPGPIDALIRNAAAANLQIKLDEDEQIVIVKPNGTHIPLLGQVSLAGGGQRSHWRLLPATAFDSVPNQESERQSAETTSS